MKKRDSKWKVEKDARGWRGSEYAGEIKRRHRQDARRDAKRALKRDLARVQDDAA